MLERKCIISIEEVEFILKEIVLDNLGKSKKNSKKVEETLEVEIKGEKIYALSDRYKVFFTKGYKCCDCGIEGKYFALERNINEATRYHLNLYAVDENGKEILMTKDHIIPKSLGGKNHLDNYQTMCCICNNKKGNGELHNNCPDPNFKTSLRKKGMAIPNKSPYISFVIEKDGKYLHFISQQHKVEFIPLARAATKFNNLNVKTKLQKFIDETLLLGRIEDYAFIPLSIANQNQKENKNARP